MFATAGAVVIVDAGGVFAELVFLLAPIAAPHTANSMTKKPPAIASPIQRPFDGELAGGAHACPYAAGCWYVDGAGGYACGATCICGPVGVALGGVHGESLTCELLHFGHTLLTPDFEREFQSWKQEWQ